MAKAPIETSNSFAALETEELKVAEESEVVIPPEPVEQRKEKPMKSAGAKISPRHCCGSNQCRQAQAGDAGAGGSPLICRTPAGIELLDFAKRQCGSNAGKSLNIFNKVMRSGSLMPIIQSPELQTRLGKFEILTAMIDSGATVAVMNPTTAARITRI